MGRGIATGREPRFEQPILVGRDVALFSVLRCVRALLNNKALICAGATKHCALLPKEWFVPPR